MAVTPEALERTRRDWTDMAGEPVSVEEIGGTLYGFCSELGALRLEHRYRRSDPDRVKALQSPTRGWCFRIELQ